MLRFRDSIVLALLATALVAVVASRADEVRSPLAGIWKLSVSMQGQDIALAIIKVDVKDTKVEASVLSTGAKTFADAEVETVKAGERSLYMTFKNANGTFNVAVHGNKDARRIKTLVGCLETRNNTEIAILEKTTDKEIDRGSLVVPTEGAGELKRLSAPDDKERQAALKEILAKYPDKPVAYTAAQRVWQNAYRRGKGSDQVREGNAFVDAAARFGREMELGAAVQVAQALLAREEDQAKAISFAQRADKLLTMDDALGRHRHVIKVLTAALRKEEKVDPRAVKAAEARVIRIEEELDQRFIKRDIPFKPEPFAGRKTASKRVAVVELFTAAHAPACVASEVAFDALLQTYKPNDVILMQYHLNGEASDWLTNPDTEERAEFYRAESAPAAFVNGRSVEELAGTRKEAEAKYGELRKVVERTLEKDARAGLTLDVKRDGDKLAVTASITALESKGARLRVFLVEDVVRYPGGNGQRLHRHVVRALLGEVDAMAPKGDAQPHRFTVDVGDLRKSLGANLDRITRRQGSADEPRPLELKHLKIVAIIQEKEKKEILNAVQVDVPETER